MYQSLCFCKPESKTFSSFLQKYIFFYLLLFVPIVTISTAVFILLVKCVYGEPGTVPTASCNFSFNPSWKPRGSLLLNLFYRWGSWGLKGFSYKGQSKDSALPNCKALAHDHLISYYLIFFLSWANCLLTSVCFAVYFPWLWTMASFLMHANSVTNPVQFFVSSKYIYNSSLSAQHLLAISSHLASLPL